MSNTLVLRGNHHLTPEQVNRYPFASFPGVFFDSLDSSARKDLLLLGRVQEHPARTEIFTQRETNTYVPLLLKGSAKLTSGAGSGKESLLSIRSSGDLLDVKGMAHLIGNVQSNKTPASSASLTPPSRTSTATALNSTTVLAVGMADFARFMRSHPEAWIVAAQDLATALTRAEERLAHREGRSANQLLAQALLSLSLEEAGMSGPPGQRGPGSRVFLSQSELASWIGVSTKTVERILAGWRKRGIIASKYRSIIITDLRKLSDLARLRSDLVPSRHGAPKTGPWPSTPVHVEFETHLKIPWTVVSRRSNQQWTVVQAEHFTDAWRVELMGPDPNDPHAVDAPGFIAAVLKPDLHVKGGWWMDPSRRTSVGR